MDLGQATRPRAEVEAFNDMTPRKKCTLCCGLRCAAFTGAAAMLITLPCNAVMLGGRLTEGNGWKGFLNRNLFVALPVAAICFTHQVLLSEALWSKNKKTVWEVNLQSTLSNIVLWVLGVGVCTTLSRRYLPARSRAYRLSLWNYRRTRRAAQNAWLPSVYGKITEDLDWYNVLWTLSLYHIVWGMLSVMLEKEMGSHYAMFFRDWQYSKWCSPRWREWRELEVMRAAQKEHKVSPARWGSFITNDRWRTRDL